MTDRSGVEIDYCPTCRGVWLDRGELDKLIERSQRDDDDDDRGRPRSRDDRPRDDWRAPVGNDDWQRPKKKRKGMLSEIFDFE